jgi:POT family proton-dependent oligopeptide transporter
MVEMWERFSFYGMRGILVLYMVHQLMFSTQKAGSVYGLYTGFVYMTPLIGGYLADRYLGARKCIYIGAVLMAIGQFCLMPHALGPFYLGLGLLIVGNGFFKPNISTTVGALYKENDPRRDGGFTIFYMGINVGAFFATIVCGYLGQKIGWHYGFGAAGIGMLIGLITLKLYEKKYLGDICTQPSKCLVHPGGSKVEQPLTKIEKQRIAVIFILMFFTIFFWSAFEQAGSSLTLFADRSTNLNILGWKMPSSWFQSLNPLFIVIFAPFFSKLWIKLAEKKSEPTTPIKFVWGLGLLGFGFVLMIFAAKSFEGSGIRVSIMWLTMVYLFHTLGELCLSPVGLSVVTKLAPAKFASLLMGVWFLGNFFANLTGGLFAGNYDSMSITKFFMIPTATALGSAVILLVLSKFIKKWMHGVH